jgi:hypothetical protein
VSVDAIRWFRLAFYDIECLRQAPARVMHELIGITDEDGQSALDPHRLLKLIGYRLGLGAVDQVFQNPMADKQAFNEGGLVSWLSQQVQITLKSKQLAVATNLDASDPKHAPVLLKLLSQEQRSQRQSETTPLNIWEQHVNAMLSEFPWCHGNVAKEVYKGTKIGEFDKHAAELRDEELLLVAAGETVPELEKIKDLKLPSLEDRQAKDNPEKGGGS